MLSEVPHGILTLSAETDNLGPHGRRSARRISDEVKRQQRISVGAKLLEEGMRNTNAISSAAAGLRGVRRAEFDDVGPPPFDHPQSPGKAQAADRVAEGRGRGVAAAGELGFARDRAVAPAP
jgi:hypothetical protein